MLIRRNSARGSQQRIKGAGFHTVHTRQHAVIWASGRPEP